MALAAVEASREHDVRAWAEHHPYTNYEYHNYVVPNLAPRAFEAGDLALRPQRATWREAPEPPPDPVWVLFQWMIHRPAVALMMAYALWLGFWSLYALSALTDV
jgi:hypothetical protein